MAPPTNLKCDLTMEDAGADNGSTRQTEGEKRGAATPERSVAVFEAHLDVAATCALRVVTELDVVRRCVAPMVGFAHMSCTCVQKDLPIFSQRLRRHRGSQARRHEESLRLHG